MDDVDIIPPSERRRINEKALKQRGQDDGNGPYARLALMAFTEILYLGGGFAAARLVTKATIDTLYVTVGLEHYFDILNALGRCMEIVWRGTVPKRLDWQQSAIMIMCIDHCLLRNTKNDSRKDMNEV